MSIFKKKEDKKSNTKKTYMGYAPKMRKVRFGRKGIIGVCAAAILICAVSVTAFVINRKSKVYAVDREISADGYIHILEIVPDYSYDEMSLSVNDPDGLISWEKFIATCPTGQNNRDKIIEFINNDLKRYIEAQRSTLDYKAPYIWCYNPDSGKFYSRENGLIYDNLVGDLDNLGYDLKKIKIGLFNEDGTPVEAGKSVKNHFGYQVFGTNDEQVQYDEDGNVKMKLVVKLAGDVTENDIDDADMVYLTGSSHAGISVDTYSSIYNRIYPDKKMDSGSAANWNSGQKSDLKAETAFYLYKEYTVGKIVLYNSADINGGENNVQRVCSLFTSIDPETFIREWADKKNDDGSYSGTRGKVTFEMNDNKKYELINIVYTDNYGQEQRMQFGSLMFAYDNTLDQDQKNKYPYYSWPDSGQFVSPNCYVFNSDTSTTRNFSNEVVKGEDYKDGLYKGTSFTEARKYNGLSEDQAMSPKQVVRYLFGGILKNSTDVKVLEIEPCRDFKYYYDPNGSQEDKEKALYNIRTFANYYKFSIYTKLTTTQSYENYINNSSNKRITFDCVTSAQFNGMNDDLIAKYDLIVVGSSDGLLNKDDNGRTIYNDTNLDGYVYLAYGDLIKTSTALTGYFADDYVCADNLQLGTGISKNQNDGFASTTNLGIDNTKIFSKNNTNNVGQSVWNPGAFSVLSGLNGDYFVLRDVSSKVNSIRNASDYYNEPLGNARFSDNDITAKQQAKLQEFIDARKPVLFDEGVSPCKPDGECLVYPTAHLKSYVLGNTANEYAVNETKAKAGALKSMELNRIVINSCSATYNDGQGVKQVPECRYVDTSDSQKGNLIDSSCIIKNVNALNYNINFTSLPGHTYTVKMLVDKNADGLYSEDDRSDDTNEVYYNQTIAGSNDANTVYSFETPLPEGYNGLLSWRIVITDNETKARQITDGCFAITGETKEVNVLQILPDDKANSTLDMENNQKFRTLLKQATDAINYNVSIKTMTAGEFEKEFEKDPYKLNIDYDNDNNYLKVHNYSMLVIGFGDLYGGDDISNDNGAVDCISDYIDHGKAVLFAHDTLTYANGVNNGLLSDGNSVYKLNNRNERGNLWASDLTSHLRSKFAMDRYDITQLTNKNVPKDIGGNDVKEIQGLNNYALYRYAENKNFRTTRADGVYTLPMYNTFAAYYSTNNLLTADSVESINEGQVTRFPYKITDQNGKLNVSNTHGQYYQLDMEDPDLVVWYTLSGDKGTYYGDSAGDAGNNYYIYSKKNITYTGAGHSSMDNEDAELKLYVNTIIKTAMAGDFVPEVKVTNGYSTSDKNTYVIHPLMGEENLEVKYVATDKDMIDNIGKFVKGGIYWIDDSDPRSVRQVCLETFSADNPVINAQERTYTIPEGSECYNYYMKNNKLKLKIIVYDYHDESGSCMAELVPRTLYDLE